MSKKEWNWIFLFVTGVAIFMELAAIFDGNADTQPWTVLITDNIPFWIGYPLIVAGCIWIVIHFWKYYKKK